MTEEDGINRRDFLAAAKGLVIGSVAGAYVGRIAAKSDQYFRSPIKDKKPEMTEEEKQAAHDRWMLTPVTQKDYGKSVSSYGPPITQPTEHEPAPDIETGDVGDSKRVAEGIASGAASGAMVALMTRMWKGWGR